MNLQLRQLFIILLIASILKSGSGSTSALNKRSLTSTESSEQDETCGKYCYKVVKQLINLADRIRLKEEQCEQLQNKTQEQEVTIIKLQQSNLQLKLDNALRQNNEQAATITKLQQQLALNDEQLTKFKSEHNDNGKEMTISAAKMNDLKSNQSEFESSNITYHCVGKSTDVHLLYLPNFGTFPAPCDSKLADSGWTVIQRRIDGSVDFDRNWDEYKAGFGDLRGEFFLGLEKIHLLTAYMVSELYIHMEDFDNKTSIAKYSGFSIGNEAESYVLKSVLRDYAGDAGDSLIEHIDMKFSTKDRDNDIKADENCAEKYKSGWWFIDCYFCNLNGKYTNSSSQGISKISWSLWKPLKFVQMMIRPVIY